MTPRTRLVGRQAHGSAQGLTLLELLLVLVLMSVVFALVIPGFVGLAGRNELISGAEQVRTAIARARSDAMRTGQTRLIIYSPGSGFYAEVAEPLDPAAESELAAVTAFIRQADDLLRSGRDVAASPPSGLRASRLACLPRDIVFLDASRLVDLPSSIGSSGNRPLAMVPPGFAAGLEFPSLRLAADGTSQDHLLVLGNLEGDQIPIALRGLTGLTEIGALASRERPYVAGGVSR